MPHPLDNPIWHALTGAHAHLAVVAGLARFYPRDVAPFAGFAEPSAAAWADLARAWPADAEAFVLRADRLPLPAGWESSLECGVVQMVRDGTVPVPPPSPLEGLFQPLGETHAPAMLALAQATRPGPFARNTRAFGHYIGVISDDRLVAMAGERMRVGGHVEISAVAVDPAARGQGLGAAMINHLCRRAIAGGETPFLHAFPDNPAVALYQRLGFRLRRQFWLHCRRPAADATRAG